jgi:hypothetical protein
MKKIISFVVASTLVMFTALPAFAETYYDKGRNNTYVINGTSTGYDIAVMSAGALFGPTLGGTGGNGKEQIRFWTRIANVTAYYNSIYGGPGYSYAGDVYAIRVDSRFYVNDLRKASVTMDRANVQPASTSSYSTLGSITDQIADFLNTYPGYPAGSILKALNNQTPAGSVDQSSYSNAPAYDWTVSIRNANGLSGSVTDLPSSVDYTGADAWASNQANSNLPSSIAATFPYVLLTGQNAGYNLCVWPQGNMAYNVNEYIGPSIYPHVYWSGTIGIQHYVNSNSSYPYDPCPVQ